MQCLVCEKRITWRSPVVYLEFDRAVHVSEFMEAYQSNERFRAEVRKVVQADCEHKWEWKYLAELRVCKICGKQELREG